MAMILPAGRRGFTRRSARGRRASSGRASSRRHLIWDGNLFAFNTLAPSSVVELVMLSETDLADLSEKPTIVRIFGELRLSVDPGATGSQSVNFAWGIRLKEADAATDSSAFNPLVDSDTSNWIIWRAGSFINEDDRSSPNETSVLPFDIRNPRKVQPDEELVLIIATTATSSASLRFSAWNRVGVLLA